LIQVSSEKPCLTHHTHIIHISHTFQTDTTGELSCWEEVIDEEKGSPFNQPKQDPLEGLFDDSAAEDATAEDQGMMI